MPNSKLEGFSFMCRPTSYQLDDHGIKYAIVGCSQHGEIDRWRVCSTRAFDKDDTAHFIAAMDKYHRHVKELAAEEVRPRRARAVQDEIDQALWDRYKPGDKKRG